MTDERSPAPVPDGGEAVAAERWNRRAAHAPEGSCDCGCCQFVRLVEVPRHCDCRRAPAPQEARADADAAEIMRLQGELAEERGRLSLARAEGMEVAAKIAEGRCADPFAHDHRECEIGAEIAAAIRAEKEKK